MNMARQRKRKHKEPHEVCEICGENIPYVGMTSGEEYDAHMKEEHGR